MCISQVWSEYFRTSDATKGSNLMTKCVFTILAEKNVTKFDIVFFMQSLQIII